MSDFNSLVQYTVENISRPVKYIIYKLTEFIRVVDKFVFRQVPSGAASGYATIEQIEGNTVVWNQLSGHNTLSFTAGVNSQRILKHDLNIPSSHVLLFVWHQDDTLLSVDRNTPYVTDGGVNKYQSTANNNNLSAGWYSWRYVVSSNVTFLRYWGNNPNANYTISAIHIYDLTAIFGAGNEPSTVADFEAWMAQNIGSASYYDYNAGELISCKMSGMQTQDSSQQTLDTIALDVTTITGINTSTNVREVIFPNGMKWSNNVSDILDMANDTATVNVGMRVFDGTENWVRVTNNVKWFSLAKTTFTDLATTSTQGTYPCSHYIKAAPGSSPSSGACGFGGSYFNVNYDNTTTTPVSTFCNYLATQYANGTPVTLVYPLATPITYTDLQDANGNPLNPRYKVEQGGTEQILPANTSTPTTVAPTLTTTYTKDNN